MTTGSAGAERGPGLAAIRQVGATPSGAFLCGFLLLAVGCAFVWAFFAIRAQGMLADEGFHVDQVLRFVRGERTLNSGLVMLPGYHAALAALAVLTGHAELDALRAYSTLAAVAAVGCFAAVARTLAGAEIVRTAQFAFLPLVFPFFFLVYTDVAALLLLLASFLALGHHRYWLAGAAGILCMLIRQNNVIWVAFAAALLAAGTLVEIAGGRGFPQLQAALRDPSTWRVTLTRTLPLLLGIALFVLFVLVNGGVALGDERSHPTGILRTGNLFFALFLFGVLLLPLHLANLSRIGRAVRGTMAVLLLAGAFVLFWITFTADHPYNAGRYSWWLRNEVLIVFTSSALHRALFFVPVGIALLSLAATPLRRRRFYLLYPFAVASLLPVWLVEQRYYIVPFTLFLLFREVRSLRFELLLAGYFGVVSIGLFDGVRRGAFFL